VRLGISTLLIAFQLAAGTAVVAQQEPFAIAPQPLPGDVAAAAADISADGRRIVGISSASGYQTQTVVIWDDLGPPTAITPPGRYQLGLLSISADGSTVVGFGDETFRWNAVDGLVEIPTVWPQGVSADGSVIFGSILKGPPGAGHAGLWDSGVVSLLTPSEYPGGMPYAGLVGARPDGRVIGSGFGYVFDSDGTAIAPLFTPLGHGGCSASSVSDDGSTVVGTCGPTSGFGYFPVRWSDHGTADFSQLTETWGQAHDVSADGSVVVGEAVDFSGSSPQTRAFVWRPRTGFRYLHELLDEAGVDPIGVSLISASGVSADGRTVVGATLIARLPEEVVPEPAAIASGIAALLALALRRRSWPARRAQRYDARTARGSAFHSGLLVALLFVASSAVAQQVPFIVAPQPLDSDYAAHVTDVSGDGRRAIGVSYGSGFHRTGVFWDDLGPATAIDPSGAITIASGISGDASTIIGTLASGDSPSAGPSPKAPYRSRTSTIRVSWAGEGRFQLHGTLRQPSASRSRRCR
jgi:uncharacterized membrane protein